VRRAAVLAAGALGAAAVVWIWTGTEAPREPPRPQRLTAAQRAEGYAQMAKALAEEGTPVRPVRPPQPGVDVPPPLPPEPQAPPDSARVHANAFARAVAENSARPGEAAFRTTVSAFVRHNEEAATRQAEQEGLTLEEVEELTAFGLMAQESQRWEEVEELVERELSEAERAAGESMLDALNREFKERMRALVAQGASPSERWALIEETQARYREAYYQLTGMNDALFDALLAGDAGRAYAPGTTPVPEDAPAQLDPEPEPPERPEAEPPEEASPPEPGEESGDDLNRP
jgi:hypothetical protein